jgi:hypothetical protein
VNREAIGPIVIGVVCVFAVVFAAATLDDPETASGEGYGTGGGSGVGASEKNGSIDLKGQNRTGMLDLADQGTIPQPCVKELNSPLLSYGLLIGMVALGGFVYRRDGAVPAIAVVAIVLMPFVAAKVMLTGCPTTDQDVGVPEKLSERPSAGGGAEGAEGGSGAVVPTNVPVFVYILVGAGLLLLFTFMISTREDVVIDRVPDVFEESEEEEEDEADTGALGRAAGRAADRIETGTGVENEVYRAWVEMTRHLDVDHPHSSTPAEFASAAVDAGIDPADVDELTTQFEAVRYGGESATEDRERRAVDALRRIEREYADDDGGEQT